MTSIPLGRADYKRSVPKEARIQTRNRFFEQNPVLTDDQAALISRPGMRRWLSLGTGPIRNSIYSQSGAFSDALFCVSGNSWYRIEKTGAYRNLSDAINPGGGGVSMAATGNIGETPEFLFLADGRNLWVYIENGYAQGQLNGVPANGDVISTFNTYYQWTNGSVDAGTPDGTVGNPWLVNLGALPINAFTNMAAAINAQGTPGTDYSTACTVNSLVQAITVQADLLGIRANKAGIGGNGITTTETGAALSWSNPTLTGGGADSVTAVQTPGDVGAISVGYIAGYVVVIPVQGAGINGRFWWINPGETTIDELDYATAERAPDAVNQVVVFGDQFWLSGADTTEVWYFTGNLDSPVLRLQGVTFDRGSWNGTAVQVKESMIIVDSDGGVFQIAGGLKRISNPSIEERIREAIQIEAARIP